ncbi:uncharacterized protein [Periplaneta americana]|uniref:uncharacterized protein n=1 Tax=Periplaneta americana TaxID=6978 RepID=UPI0037E87EE7
MKRDTITICILALGVLCGAEEDEEDSEEDEVSLRAGFELFRKKFPEPFVLTSGGQAVQGEQSVLRGTYTTSTTSSLVFELYGGQASISAGDFGSWIVPSEDFGRVLSNITRLIEGGESQAKNSQLDVSILMSKLWVSAILRDNIVTTFGFVLNRPDNPLPTDLYSSLYVIYNFIRLRRIHTTDFLPVLKKMSYSAPQEQFIILFEELHRQIPNYLKSTASVWVEALSQNHVNLNEIIRPGKGRVEVDFLASLDSSVLEVLEEKSIFMKETVEKSSSSIKVMMGPLFADVFAALEDGSLQLTQPLFALILLHLPLDKIVPHKDETQRYIVDALRLNSVEHWDLVVGRLQPQDVMDPFRLVRAVLQSIVDEPKIELKIKQDALYVLPHVRATSQTFAQPYYSILSEVIGQPRIKFKILLQHITVVDYPQEVVELKDRLLYYIKNGYADMELVATGFIRYDYITPNDLLIAILTRIIHRLPNLSDEILATVKALQQALVFKRLLCSLSPVIPPGFIYAPALLDAFGNPALPTRVRELEKVIANWLVKKSVDWSTILDYTPIEECSSPRQCFVTVITKAIAKGVLVNSPVLVHIEELLLLVDRYGNIKNGKEGCPKDIPVTIDKANGRHSQLSVTTKKKKPTKSAHEIYTPHLPTTLTTNIPKHQTIPKTQVETSSPTPPFNFTYPTPPPDTNFPPFSISTFHVSISIDQREQLLPPTIPFSPEDILLKPLRDFIVCGDLLEILGPNFHPEQYPTKALLLHAILQRALVVDIVKMNNPLHSLIQQYLQFLIQQMQSYKPAINYVLLLDALPPARNQEEFQNFQILRAFLTSQDIHRYLVHFDVMRYHTRGMLLQSLLLHLLKQEEIYLNPDLLRAIEYYSDKVYLNGFGAKSVEYIIIKQEVQRRTINLQSAFKAINLNELDFKGEKALRGVYRFFAKEFQPPLHLSNFEFMKYITKGEWLTAYFRYLVNHPAVSDHAKLDISNVLPYVLLTGPGAEPVE